jgi:hypothetical protein
VRDASCEENTQYAIRTTQFDRITG